MTQSNDLGVGYSPLELEVRSGAFTSEGTDFETSETPLTSEAAQRSKALGVVARVAGAAVGLALVGLGLRVFVAPRLMQRRRMARGIRRLLPIGRRRRWLALIA